MIILHRSYTRTFFESIRTIWTETDKAVERSFIMKRKIALVLTLTFLVCCIAAIPGSADTALPSSEMLGEVFPQAAKCEDGCGPYTLRCSDVIVTSAATHPVNWGGYDKTCEYTAYEAYTLYTCQRCGYRFAGGTHSHGATEHEPSICGQANMLVCFLDGTVYRSLPEELLADHFDEE